MNNIAHDLREFLLADAVITSIAREIHRNDVTPSTERPFVRLIRQRANDDFTRDGYGLLTESVFGVDCIGNTQHEADMLSDAVKNRLQSQAATMGQSVVRGVFVRDKSDDYHPFPEASDEVIPFASMDAEVWHV